VLCLALPERGESALAGDLEELLTSETLRRAARHVAGRIHHPLADLPAGDDELARTIADLVARAGRASRVSGDQLEHARLVLELARLERAIRRARAGGGGDIAALAREREAVRDAVKALGPRLDG
jgi:hypothetical protein